MYKLDIDKSNGAPHGLKSKVDKLDIGKLESTPVDLSKSSDVKRLNIMNQLKKIIILLLLILVIQLKYNTKSNETENKITDCDYSYTYINTQQFN